MSRMSCSRQRRGHALHDRVLALAALEQAQLAPDVALVLAGQLRVLRVGGVAVERRGRRRRRRPWSGRPSASPQAAAGLGAGDRRRGRIGRRRCPAAGCGVVGAARPGARRGRCCRGGRRGGRRWPGRARRGCGVAWLATAEVTRTAAATPRMREYFMDHSGNAGAMARRRRRDSGRLSQPGRGRVNESRSPRRAGARGLAYHWPDVQLPRHGRLQAGRPPAAAAARRHRPRSRLRRPLQRRQVQRAQCHVQPAPPGQDLQDAGPHPAAGLFRSRARTLPGRPARLRLRQGAAADLRAHWQEFINKYFQTREALGAWWW